MSGYCFTLAKVADHGRTAAKKIVGKDDGSRETFPYDNVWHWLFWPKQVAGHDGMAALLRRLAARQDVMLVMGMPTAGLDLARAHARRWADPARSTLVAVDRAWLPVDVDDFPVPAPFGRADQLANAARCVRDDALGEEFAGVECVVGATSSTGLAGEETARLRLFFLLDRKHPLAELYRWAQGAQFAGLPVDPAVLQAGQPIYTARPIFRGKLSDPVPVALHAFVLPGSGDRVALDIHGHDRRATEIESRVEHARTRCGSDWRQMLDETLGGRASFFLPLTQALGLAARSGEAEAEILRDIGGLVAARADEKRQRQYGERWVLSTLRRFRRFDHQAAADIARRRRQLFGDSYG